MSQKKQQKSHQKYQPKEKDKEQDQKKQDKKEQKKVHRGVFIAEERRKGRGGRIKSNSMPNKIEVRFQRDVAYLHQSEVQWIQVGRYSKKQGRKRKKQQKKQKYKSKQQKQDKATHNQQTKYVLKQEKQTSQLKQAKQQQEQTKQQENENDRGQQSSEHSDSDVENQKKQQNNQQQQEADKKNKQEDDIVIIGQIKKQISNPFWKKPFVGIIRFMEKQKKSSKYKQKDNQKSYVSRILDDFNIDFEPIHARLPICYIQINNQSERVLQEYVEKNIKFQQKQKGGKIRNRILDQLQSTYALVTFLEKDRKSIYVNLVKIIGKAKTIDGECNCFLYQHQLNDFAHDQSTKNQIITQIKLTPSHKVYEQMVFTIDPLTSTDLDDALSVRLVNQNQYQFGIHISDVSSYLDKIPRQQLLKRTTSVYLPHYVFHMLPSHLVSICSLNPNVSRLAFTVFVRMTGEGDVLSSRLQKNVIKSRFKLSYEQAQSIIVNQKNFESFKQIHNCSEDQYNILVQKIKIMQKVGLSHRKKRLLFQIFDNDQIQFELDKDKWPIDYKVRSRFSAKKIVEQFMIIGNIQSAKKLIEFDPNNSLVIHHPRPSQLGIRQFNQYFQLLNYKFKFEDSISLQKDLLEVTNMPDISQNIKKLCYFKARRVQQTAAYKRFSQIQNIQGNIHFALGLRHYTHFTSPMRRIADILVHQVLSHVVDNTIPKKQLTQKEIQQSNWGRKNTKKLKRDLTQIYLCLMIYKTQKVIQTQAIVVSFGCKSVSIFIPLFDTTKEIMWKDMRVDKVFKNKQNEKNVDVVIHYDKKSAKKDIIWLLQKFQKIVVKIGCSTQIPLRLVFQFQVKTNKDVQKIKPKPYN